MFLELSVNKPSQKHFEIFNDNNIGVPRPSEINNRMLYNTTKLLMDPLSFITKLFNVEKDGL